MKTGYDQFFKNARKAANDNGGAVKFTKNPAAARLHLDLSSEDVEQQIRRRMKMTAPKKSKKKKSGVHWKMAGFSFIGLLLAVVGFQNHEQIDEMLKRVEITLTGEAIAETAKPAAKAEEKKAEAAPVEKEATEAKTAFSTDEIDHLTKLNDRKKELDAREEELNRQEVELQAQKTELDKRLKDLEDMRGKISSMLENRVKADDQKVDTLVQMYTNMKAPQAAKVFETMDEDLVVEILGRMKKKNAADIMNLLKPEKAQTISEKYAGYKRTPASEK
jgi:flagellar motility protein MotE (MotC chaperone)